jgi:hypothetical protein
MWSYYNSTLPGGERWLWGWPRSASSRIYGKITVEIPVEALSYRRILGLLNISTIKVVHGNRQF